MKALTPLYILLFVFILWPASNAQAYYAHVDALTGSYGGSIFGNYDTQDNVDGMTYDEMTVYQSYLYPKAPYVAAQGSASLASGNISLYAFSPETCNPALPSTWYWACHSQNGAYGKLFDEYTFNNANAPGFAQIQQLFMGINISGSFSEAENWHPEWFADATIHLSYANVNQMLAYSAHADQDTGAISFNTTIYVPLPDINNNGTLDILTALAVTPVGGAIADFSNTLDIFFMSEDPNVQLSVTSAGGYSQQWQGGSVPEPTVLSLFLSGLLALGVVNIKSKAS